MPFYFQELLVACTCTLAVAVARSWLLLSRAVSSQPDMSDMSIEPDAPCPAWLLEYGTNKYINVLLGPHLHPRCCLLHVLFEGPWPLSGPSLIDRISLHVVFPPPSTSVRLLLLRLLLLRLGLRCSLGRTVTCSRGHAERGRVA
ncbi:hypothetical protein V8C37DRAFT_392526 [Trichoderma ceciliae]